MNEGNGALHEWHEDVEQRAKGRKHAIQRGTRRGPGAAPGAWRCEGRWQVEDQLDIWQCIDAVELDERRKHGNDDDMEDSE